MIKIFGIQRSGTNYLRTLLQLNFGERTLVHELGWKHGPPADPRVHFERHFGEYEESWAAQIRDAIKNKNVIAIVIAKNPYTWVNSIQRFYPEEIINKTSWFISAWNRRYRSWLKLVDEKKPFLCYKHAFVVSYEDLLRDLEGSLKRLESETGLKLLSTENPREVENSRPFTKTMREWYLNPRPNKEISSLVDWEVAKRFGYRRLP